MSLPIESRPCCRKCADPMAHVSVCHASGIWTLRLSGCAHRNEWHGRVFRMTSGSAVNDSGCTLCRFLVAGRTSPDGTFKTLDDIDVPEALQVLPLEQAYLCSTLGN